MAQDKAADILNFNAPGDGGGARNGALPAPPPTGARNQEAPNAGAMLAAARAEAGVNIEVLSAAIKVKVEHLQSIEAMRPDLLPPLPYVIGFVKAYAGYLGLDTEEMAARFRADAGAAAPVSLTEARAESRAGRAVASPPQAMDDGSRLVSLFGIGAIILFVAWILFQIVFDGGRDDRAPVAPPERRVTMGQAQISAPQLRAPGVSAAQAPSAADDSAAEQTDPAPAQTADDTQATDNAAAPVTSPLSAPQEESAPEEIATEEETLTTVAETGGPVAPTLAPRIKAPSAAATGEDVAPNRRPLPRRPAARVRPEPAAPVETQAKLTRSVAPTYPNRCTRNAQGLETVTVIFDVSAGGRAVNTRVAASSNDCFEGEALSVLERWRFEPKTVNGEPAVETGKSATLNFRK